MCLQLKELVFEAVFVVYSIHVRLEGFFLRVPRNRNHQSNLLCPSNEESPG